MLKRRQTGKQPRGTCSSCQRRARTSLLQCDGSCRGAFSPCHPNQILTPGLCSPSHGATAPTAPNCPHGVAAPQHSLQDTLNAASPWITMVPGQVSLTCPSFASLRFSGCPVCLGVSCSCSLAPGTDRFSAPETSHPPAPTSSCTRPSAQGRDAQQSSLSHWDIAKPLGWKAPSPQGHSAAPEHHHSL